MVDVQRALYALARSRPADGLRVRVGVHTGEVIVGDDGDLFGRHVVIASRVADAARGGEILVSELVRELVEPGGDFTFGPPRLVPLKGLGAEHPLHPVVWDDRTGQHEIARWGTMQPNDDHRVVVVALERSVARLSVPARAGAPAGESGGGPDRVLVR